jgi:hypothetical protein
MRLVDRADKHVQSLKSKAFGEFTPEDIGHVCADLEGIIAFVRTCQERGVFAQSERMEIIEANVARNIEWQCKFDEKLAERNTNEARVRELIEQVNRLENAIRSFTSEEGDNLAESLFDTFDSHDKSVWQDEMDKHRKRIEELRALVMVPTHQIS